MNNWTRKQFIRASLLGGSAALVAGSSRVYGQAPAVARKGSANGDIRVAVVGVGGQGNGHMRTYFKMPGARLVAICDTDDAQLASRKADCDKAEVKVTTFKDYRKVLEDRNIDAVVLATPNHQHSLQTIWALQAGKDVYVEKPLSHNVWEGRQAVLAAQKYKRNIAFVGTQNRSSEDIREAIAYARSGKLGKVQWARGLCYKSRESIGLSSGPQPIPETVDYDLWTGPADLIPSRRNGKRGPIHYDWHWFWNYGGGDITNQGIHQMDIARWILGEPGLPDSVLSFGGRFGYIDDAETPNTLISVFNYKSAPLIFEVRGLPMKAGMRAMDRYRAASVGVIVQYEHGYIHAAENGAVTIYDNDHKRIQALTKGGNAEHRANFVKSMQTRELINSSIEECHYSSALCHLGNVSYLVGAEKSNAEVAEAVRSSTAGKEAYGRVLEHLKQNEVNLDSTKFVVGPLLQIDRKTETIVGPDRTLANAANWSPLLKREGRGAFRIPTV